MAIKVRLPNSGSTLTSSGSIPCSLNSDVWLGFATPVTSSGCVIFYHTTAASSGYEIVAMALSPANIQFFPYPINSPSGIYAATGSGGSVFAWTTL